MADRFFATHFGGAIAALRESTALASMAVPGAPSAEPLLKSALDLADVHFKTLKLSGVLRSQWERLRRRSRESAPMSELIILIRELEQNLIVEMDEAWFLMVPKDKRFVYEQPHPIFGQETHDAFPDARRDIAAAGRCFAVDEWTACVMHLMRALEQALRWLANRVGLKPEETEGANWKNIIDRIERKIRELEQRPKSPAKNENIQFLSEAATQFRWFKDAWRNEAAHAHVYYDEREGAPIFLHVSDFFRHLATEAVKDAQP